MMDIKRIINDIMLHNYQAAHEYIVMNSLQPICGVQAMRILVKISHTLATVQVSDTYVVKIVRSLEFEDLDGKLLSDYLSCIYYVVKYLLDSKNYELVLQLENYLQPAFLGNMQTDNTFKGLCNILHTGYIHIYKNFKEYKADFIFKYVTMLTEMTVRGLENFPVRIEHYLSLLFYMQFDFGKIEDFYFNFYELIKCKELKESKENFKGLFIMLSKMCNYYAKKDQFELVQDLINKSLHKLLEYAGNEASLIEECFNISTVFTTLDKYTEDSHVIMEDFLVNLHAADKFFVHLLAPFVIQIFNESLKGNVHWNEIITIPFVKTYFNLATTLAEIVTKLPFKCCCNINSDLSTTFKVTMMKSRLIKCVLSAGRSKEINDDLHKLTLKSFDDCYVCLKIMEKHKCKMYESYFQLLGTMLYNISVKLYHSKDKICLMYFKLFTKYSLNIQYTKGTELREDISNCTLFLMADVYIREQQYYNGLQVAALNIFLYPNNSKFSIQQWMKCKKLLGFKYRNMSIVCILNNNIDYFKELDNDFEKITDCAVIVKLLLIELNAYNKQWPDITYGLLCELNFHADQRTIAKAVVSMNFSDILKLDRNIVIDIIKPCLEYLENIEQKDPESNIILGCLYFLCFKFSVLELKEKNKEVSEPPDIVNECDMTHTYEYLQVFTYNKIYPYLNKSLQSLTEGITSDQLDLSTIHNEIIEVTQELAYEFKLHCNLINALNALLITLKLVKAINNVELLITISAAIVEHLDVDSKQYIDLTKGCDEIIKCSNDLKHTILCTYYSSICFANLKCGRLDECKQMYEIASEHYYKFEDEMTDMDVDAVKLHYIYLQMQLAHLSCSDSIHNHQSLALIRQYTAYKIIFGWVKSTRKLSLEFLSLSMDVLEEILHFYVWMRLPREVRCFGKEAFELAQELLLPIRTVRFIIYLARADLLSCKFDECETKLEKLSNILQLTKYKSTRHDLLELSGKVEELSLENPSMVRMVSTNSPILYREKFRLPVFILHDSHCNCFPCSNMEYKDLVIQKIHMDALLNEVHENSVGALECYNGISTILKKVDKNQCQEQTCLLLNFKYFNSTHNFFMVDFIKYYMKEGNYEMAKKLIVKLIKKIKSETYKNYHLYNEVLKMYVALLGDFKEVINVNSNDVQYCILGEPKTPERRISKVNVKQMCSHLILSPRQNHIEKPCNSKSKTPYAADKFLVPKTPAPSFKIYTPECTNVRSMKKSTISAKRTVQKNLSVFELENTPMSTEKAARMKMLTEKLKNSNNPNILSNDNEVKNTGSVSRGAIRRNVKRLQKDGNDLKGLQSVRRNLLDIQSPDSEEVNKSGKPTETEETDFLDLEPSSINKTSFTKMPSLKNYVISDLKSVRQNLSVENNTQEQRNLLEVDEKSNKEKQKQLDGNNVRKSARKNVETPKHSEKKTMILPDEREGIKKADNDTKILATELLDIEPLVGAQRKSRTRQTASNKLSGLESPKTKENKTGQTSSQSYNELMNNNDASGRNKVLETEILKITKLKKTKEIPLQEKKTDMNDKSPNPESHKIIGEKLERCKKSGVIKELSQDENESNGAVRRSARKKTDSTLIHKSNFY